MLGGLLLLLLLIYSSARGGGEGLASQNVVDEAPEKEREDPVLTRMEDPAEVERESRPLGPKSQRESEPRRVAGEPMTDTSEPTKSRPATTSAAPLVAEESARVSDEEGSKKTESLPQKSVGEDTQTLSEIDPASEPSDESTREPEPEPESELVLPESDASEGAAREVLLPDLEEAGSAGLSGVVFGPSGESLAGVLVRIADLDRTVRSDSEGLFAFSNLPAGEFVLTFNKLGYRVGEKTIGLKADETAEVSQSLEEKPVEFDDGEYELDEVDVVGEFVEEVERDALEFDLGDFDSGGRVTTGLTAEDFEKSDASDAADAVATVVGANIVDGKFAVVRGLADRYVTTTYNGGAIASSVPNRKAIELDLFPTSVLEGLDVSKTYSPNLSGDFGGAAIDIKTKSFPAENFIKLSSEFQFIPDLPTDILSVSRTELGFLGDVELSFDLASIVDAQGGIITTGDAPPEIIESVGENLFLNSRSLSPDRITRESPRSIGLALGRNFQPTEHFEGGFLLSLNQKQSFSFNRASRIRVDEVIPETDEVQQFGQTREWDVYLSGGIRLFDQHQVGASFFRKHTGSLGVDSVTDLRRPNSDEGFGFAAVPDLDQLVRTAERFGAAAELTGSSFAQESLERDLEVFQVSGNHQFGERGPRLNWNYTDSSAREFSESSFFQFGVLDFASDELIAGVDAVVGAQGVNTLLGTLNNPAIFTGVGVPTFDSNIEAIPILTEVINGLTVDDLTPGAADVFGVPPELLLAQIVRVNQNRLANAQEAADLLDTSLPSQITLSNRSLVEQPGAGLTNTRGFQIVEEEVRNTSVDLTLPFYFQKESERSGFELLLGAGQKTSSRSTSGLSAQLLLETTVGSADNRSGSSLSEASIELLSNALEQDDFDTFESLLAGFISGSSGLVTDSSTGAQTSGNIFTGRVSSVSDTEIDIQSYYLGGHLFWEDSFIRGGLRFEDEVRDGTLLPPFAAGLNPDFPGFSESQILPSISFGTSLFDDRLSLFGAWSRTVARPTFFEFVPVVSLDLSENLLRQGNADLINTEITNFDFSAALRFGEESLLRVSLFHKQLNDPIVTQLLPSGDNVIGFINGESGLISGVELELNFLEARPWSLTTNLTFIDASLDFPSGIDGGGTVTTEFPFQPRFIANVNLGYEDVENGWGVNLIYNHTGAQNTLLPATVAQPTIRQDALFNLDLVARKTFDWDGVGEFKLTAGIKNLLANDREQFFTGGGALNSPLLFDGLANVELRFRSFFIGGELQF